jgi:hypothetical protein
MDTANVNKYKSRANDIAQMTRLASVSSVFNNLTQANSDKSLRSVREIKMKGDLVLEAVSYFGSEMECRLVLLSGCPL